MKHVALVLSLILLAAGAAFASGDYEDHGFVVGSGAIQAEDRDVPAFDSVEVDGSGNVTVSQSSSQRVRVETDDNILPLVRTEVVGGVLHLGLVNGAHVQHLSRLEFSVAAPRVKGITISGSGNARTASALRADDMRLDIRGSGNIDCEARAATLAATIGGSGDITVRGRADRVSAAIDGSGSVRARDLESSAASVRINGSGDVVVNAIDTVDIDINGSGSVHYTGGARATVHRSARAARRSTRAGGGRAARPTWRAGLGAAGRAGRRALAAPPPWINYLGVNDYCGLVKQKLAYDDSLDAFGVHGIGEPWERLPRDCSPRNCTTPAEPTGCSSATRTSSS